MNKEKQIEVNLLDCTLRDGSYVLDFQFTSEDTTNLCRDLQGLGFEWIEVGHGVGLGASESGYGESAQSDEEYMVSANGALSKSKWGMFCIPGIANIEHLKLAISHGMDFIRIGIDPQALNLAEPFIKLSKQSGLFTAVNFMKSYTEPPKEFAKFSREAERMGADLIYIVDSAGGMFPETIKEYVGCIRDLLPEIKLGFHGHNNLGLSVANSIASVEAGASFVDVSLQGLGRGAGNVPSEQFVCALIKKGIEVEINPIALMDTAEKHYNLLDSNKGINSLDTISGLADFHSSYMQTIQKYSLKYKIDPRKLIIAVSEVDKKNAHEEIVDKEAKKLQKQGNSGSWKTLYKHYFGKEQDD